MYGNLSSYSEESVAFCLSLFVYYACKSMCLCSAKKDDTHTQELRKKRGEKNRKREGDRDRDNDKVNEWRKGRETKATDEKLNVWKIASY